MFLRKEPNTFDYLCVSVYRSKQVIESLIRDEGCGVTTGRVVLIFTSLGYIHIRCVSAAAVAIDLCTLGCVMHIGQYP